MDGLVQQWSQAPSWAKVATGLALPAAGFLAAQFLDDYRAWLAVGPGGLPYNLTGYLANVMCTAMLSFKDTIALDMYEKPEKYASGWKEATDDEKTKARKSFLNGSLPQRQGPRAKALHFCAPQRERSIDTYIDPDLKQTYLTSFDQFGNSSSDSIEWGTSVLERRGKAMFLKDTYRLPAFIAKCKREFAHIHESDMSAHVLLSFTDAKDVIAKGWGERHRMTGSIIPLGYTLLYLPRNKDEIEVLMKIVQASSEYAKSNGKDE